MMNKYYLIGIKGAGMSALGQLLYDQGHYVKGCDYEEDFYTTKGLHDRNIVIEDIEKTHITKEMIVICGNAFIDHPLVLKSKQNLMEVFTYSQFLGKLSKETFSVAISGTHGKTTTTNLCRQLFGAQESVNFIVGDGVGEGHPLSDTFIFEACEYKRHFHQYYPKVAILTNIDYDHPDYYKDLADVKLAFEHFMHQSHMCIYNGDDEHLSEIAHYLKKKISYGLNQTNDFYATNITNDGMTTSFDAYCKGKLLDHYTMPLFGTHNVYNALAAITFALYMGVTKKDIKEGLRQYQPSKRRFETFDLDHQIVISDYAHHPTEIKATHEALRLKYPTKTIIAIFEPHTFSRTKQFINEFKEALELYDQVYLQEIFTSVREHDETIKISDLAKTINNCEILDSLYKNKLIQHQDAVLIFMGAGNIDKIALEYVNVHQKGQK